MMRYEDASQTGSITSDVMARDDADHLAANDFGPATGNIIAGSGTITGATGTDMAGPGGHITAIAGAGGTDTSFEDGNLEIAGQYGVLTIDTNGNYSYARNPGTPDGVSDVFTYTLANAAGATDSAKLTINIGDLPMLQAQGTRVVPGTDGRVVLPAGVELSDIRVVGRDLVVTLPDGSTMTIVDGAVFVPQLVLGGIEVPASNLAALLIGSEPQPAAGDLSPLTQSSGGNFAVPVQPLDPGVPLGDLLPPTELSYVPPDFEEIQFLEEDDEPEIVIIPDGQPAAVNAVDSVDEAGLPVRGSEPEGSGEEAAAGANGDPSEATSGVISISAEDGIASVTINGVEITTVGQVINGDQGTLTITSINLATGQIGYSYLLTDNTNPGGDGISDFFSVTVTDSDGDTATATLTIDIIDDEPIARNDTDAVTNLVPTTDGNVMTGVGTTSGTAGKDTVGADNASLTAIASVNVPANSDNTFDGSGNLVVQGQFGTLTIKADGSYVYTLSGNQGAGGNEVFTYTLTDGDGDIDTATLTITVPPDFIPQPANATAIVDDDGLPLGNHDSAPGDDVVPNTDGDNNESTFSGTLTANFGTDTPGTFSLAAMNGVVAVLGQETVQYSWNDATDTLTAEITASSDPTRIGLDLYTVHLNPNGQFDVTLLINVLQIDDGTNTENNATAVLTFTATDADGDSTNATLTITFDDDIPTAIIPPPPPPGEPQQPLLGGFVDEDALPDGNNDSAPGDDPGGTTASGAAGSLGALFNAGADQPLTFSLSGDTSGLPSLTSNGVPVTYAVVGNVLTASAGASTVFTLTVNADGSWTFELEDQLDHPTADTEDNLLLDLSSIVVATDADGDEVTAAAGAFVIDVDDDLPVPADVNAIVGLVDEDDLPTGNNDDAPGDDDPDNLDGDNDGTTTGGGAPSLATLFNGGADQPLTILLSTDTSGLEAQALTSQGAALAYDVDVDSGVLTGYAESGDNPGFQAGEDRTVFTLTVNENGTWEFDLQDQLDHPVAGTEDNLLIDFSSVITAVDADGDTAELPDDMFVIDVDDDMPQEFEECPEAITTNDAGSTFTGSLNLPPVGADEPGTVSFLIEDGDPALDTGGEQMTSEGQPIFYFINDEGVLEARVGDETGDVVFTITINDNGTFTYDQLLPIDDGSSDVSFDDLTSTSAGNVEFRGVGADDPATTIDLLLSAEDGGADATVNTDSDSIGAANQSMDAGETVRIDFVSDLTSGGATPSGFNYSGHVSTNSFIGLIPQVQGSQPETVAFTVWALDSTNTDATEPDRDPAGGFSDSTITAITEVTVKDFLTGDSTTVPVTFTDGVTFVNVAYGISVRVNADGSVTFSGIQQGDSYGFSTGAGDFNAVAVQSDPTGTGGSTEDSFDLGVFSIGTEGTGEPVDFDVPIALTDADGDPVVCDIEVHLGPPLNTTDVTVTVNEAGLPVIGSDEASDSEIQSGDLQGLVSGGTGPYTFTLVSNGNGTFGTLVLNADGTFTYTLDTPVDSQPDADDGTNPEIGAESFTYEATDSLGATQTGTITINIIDDVPTANDDGASQTVEDAPITVDVLANDVEGADGVDEDNNPTVRVELVAGTLSGTGTLVYNDDGTFTYTPSAGEEGVVTFDYQITDGDGDTSVATVTIELQRDSVPQVGQPQNLIVDEDGLAGANVDDVPLQGDPGETDSTESASQSGEVVVNFGSDVPGAPLADSIVLLDDSAYDGQLVDLDGNPVTFALNGSGQLVGSANSVDVIIISITGAVAGPLAGDVTYTYQAQLLQPVQHADVGNNENTDLLSGVQFQVTDSDGDADTGSFSVTVVDDVPSAEDVEVTQSAEDANVNVDITGSITAGADGVDLADVTFSAHTGSGTLSYNDAGVFTYDPAPGETGDVTFTYTVVDGDGDEVTADVTIHLVDDSVPQVGQAQNLVVDEDGLAGANVDDAPLQSDPAEVDSTENATGSGQVVVNFGSDVPGAPLTDSIELLDDPAYDGQLVDLDGNPVTFALNGSGQLVGSANSVDVIIISITGAVAGPGAGDVTYSYQAQLLQPVQHADVGNNENTDLLSGVQFQVTDSDGDPATGSFNVTVVDDVPSVSDVVAASGVTLDETTAGSPAGFPISNTSAAAVITATQVFGADGAAASDSVVYGLSIVGGSPEPSGLATAIGDHAITLVQIDSDTIEGQYEDGGTQTAFTIQMNGDGTVTLTQEVPLEHLVDGSSAAAHDDSLDLSGLINATIAITDGDGDTATGEAGIGANLVFEDDGPSAQVDGQVATDQLTLDESPLGEDEGGDSDPAGIAEVTADFSNNFVTPIDYGADGPAAADAVVYSLALSADGIGSGLYALDNSDTDAGDGDGYGQGDEILLSQSGDTVTGSVNGTDYFTISINPATGVVTFTQLANVWHADTADDDDTSTLTTADPADLQVVQTVEDADGDTASASIDLGAGVFHIEDDGPQTIQPDAITGIENEVGATATADLDDDGEVITDFGTDGEGLVQFANITNGEDSGFESGGDTIEYFLSADGQTLEGRTNATLPDGSDGTLIFTVAIDQTNGEYTFTLDGTIDNGSGVTFSNLSGGVAGNPPFKLITEPGVDLELLATPINAGSVNSDSDDIAVDSQFIDIANPDKGIRFDFGDFTYHANGGGTSDDAFVIEEHSTINGFKWTIDQISNGTTADVRLKAIDADEDGGVEEQLPNPAGDVTDPITMVKIFDAGGTLVGTFTADGTLGGIGIDFEAGGTVLLTNMLSDYSIQTYTADGYNRIEITNAGTSGGTDGKFSLSQLSIETSQEGDPVNLVLDLSITDADGDSETMVGAIDITIDPADSSNDALFAPLSFGNESSSFSMLGSDSQDQQLQKVAANSNSTVLAAAVAAAGFAASSAAAAPGNFESLDTFTFSNAMVGREMVSDLGGYEAGTGMSTLLGGGFEGADFSVQSLSSSSHMAMAASHVGELAADLSIGQATPNALLEATTMMMSQFAAPAPSMDLAMPSAEMLVAAGLTGNAQANAVVEQILVDALQGGASGPDIDSLLASLPGNGLGGNAGLDALASPAGENVPTWNMGHGGGFTFDAATIITSEAMVLHHDAVQPVANG